MRLKICGATRTADIALLADGGADLVGLWCGVPGGHADLPADRLGSLAGAVSASGMTPVLVTFLSSSAAVVDLAAAAGVEWVQLHGYQQPGTARALKAAGLTVVKVLHVRDGRCLETPLIGAYERAGVDLFLLDAVGTDGALGSTGQSLDPAVVLEVAEAVTRPFLLAGGLRADSAGEFRAVSGHPRFAGIDVDSGSRGTDGRFDRDRIALLRREWTDRAVAG
ncbi:phosphoribosylanthranilate isomerase [Actinokineospora alba]|uniref:N-(5'-phosphoribosyl)anthranilate isomerase n=1 Tax=Actinokineospora alba TaxID=504798 RepID=A0A1H0R7S5_9PSEU|nr:N-(5'-phosphoribosyl)anthranilate isomerase [Actinokineospora alba]TDP70230.1 phosphoribosylanthranilate isomerase [Actinokineospora alba]SDI36252.1 phosphoribosylanthranilate isomerase [Actinokineospora alba]SDP25018.1 phosphoribosylanthranilate isomerase [Actinokineospora alba]